MFAVGVCEVLIRPCVCRHPPPHVKIPLSYWCVTLLMEKKGLVLCDCVFVCAMQPGGRRGQEQRERVRMSVCLVLFLVFGENHKSVSVYM